MITTTYEPHFTLRLISEKELSQFKTTRFGCIQHTWSMAQSSRNVPSTDGCHHRILVLLVLAFSGRCRAIYVGLLLYLLKSNCSIVVHEIPPLLLYWRYTGKVNKFGVILLHPSLKKNCIKLWKKINNKVLRWNVVLKINGPAFKTRL